MGAGRLTAKHGAFRPGQRAEDDYKVDLWKARLIDMEAEVENAKEYIATHEMKRDQRLEAKMSGVRILFNLMDDDNSGFLDAVQVAALYAQMGKKLNPQQLTDAMAEMDSDGGGKVELDEFMKWWTLQGSASQSTIATAAGVDIDGEGVDFENPVSDSVSGPDEVDEQKQRTDMD
jgi:hypothetical protein